MKLIISIFVICLIASSCVQQEAIEIRPLEIMEVPPGFPEIEHSEGNEFSLERWELGKKLFYDPVLSKDGLISCGSCHDPSLAFSDDEITSAGSGGLIGTRNAPTLVNVAYHPYFTREGGVPTLEMQALIPIQEHNEFNNNIVLIADTLKTMEVYNNMSQEAFGQEPTPFVITRALAQFQRSLISGQSPYDLENHYGLPNPMSASARRGQELFESERTNCSSCHGGFNFSNYSFQNNGLYTEYTDEGRAKLTNKEEDLALFKVPSLRNIEVTGPYMHDGSISTIKQVIEHYNTGGNPHINKNTIIRPLNLTDEEKEDLEQFLLSLTDSYFLGNDDFQED